MIDNLAARLLAAIEETERVARATFSINTRAEMRNGQPAPRWQYEAGTVVVADNRGRDIPVVAKTWEREGQHIIHNDPATALRRCAADRKIVELHEPVAGFSGQQCTTCVGCWATEEGEDWPCENLRLLAEGYGITTEETT